MIHVNVRGLVVRKIGGKTQSVIQLRKRADGYDVFKRYDRRVE